MKIDDTSPLERNTHPQKIVIDSKTKPEITNPDMFVSHLKKTNRGGNIETTTNKTRYPNKSLGKSPTLIPMKIIR